MRDRILGEGEASVAMNSSLSGQLQSALGASYTLERELTGGGMSRVFVAHDVTLGRRVVVKTLAPESPGELSADRFRREIQLVASLQQANIVPLLTAGEVGGVPYYTMPFVEGESLRARLAARGPHSIGETINILRDVARALAFAHQHGVVHRDIKPDNILLSGSTAVVTDFGIAKALAAARTAPNGALTQTGLAVGTPAYVAPEQASGDPRIDHRADLYALGVVGYELLAGAPPFAGRTPQATLAAHVVERPRPVGERRPDTPPALAALVMQCLEKDPDRRPQSALEVLAALESGLTPSDGIGSTHATAKPSIAVLPFANLSPDPADEYFADGLTDEIITDLSPIRALHVIARASMMRFKGTGKDPLAVARELGVRYVLDGSVRRAGSSLRLTARLIDSDDGSTLWAEKLGGTVEDVFAMQERVSRTIVNALRLTLNPREDERLRARPISDVRAYEYFLQARQAMWMFTLESLDRAEHLIRDAQRLIGENARLLSALGVVHLHYLETGQVDPKPHLEAAGVCASRLAALDPDSFELHSLRGSLHFKRGEIREAIQSLVRARELEPNNSDVPPVLCYAYLMAGMDERARELANAAVRLDPLTPLFQCMPGFCEVMAGRPSLAIPYYKRFLEMDPANPAAHCFLAWTLAEAGDPAMALERADELARRFPSTMFGQVGGAFAHALRGDREAGLAAISNELRSLSRRSEMFSRFLAVIETIFGNSDAAIDLLQNLVDGGFAHYPYLARGWVKIAPLRTHPRFQRLLEVVRERWERGGTSAADLAAGSATNE